MRKRTVARIVISSLAGFVFFLILLAIANILIPNINNNTYTEIVYFFNTNLGFLILLAFIGLINEIFWSLFLPFNLIAPITSSLFSYYLLVFFARFWNFLRDYINTNVTLPFDVLYIIIPLIVLFVGYVTIIIRSGKPREYFDEKMHREHIERRKRRLEREIKDINRAINRIKWEDVGEEFKHALYNLGRSINHLFENKEKKVKNKDKKKK